MLPAGEWIEKALTEATHAAIALLKQQGWRLTCVESCTGGWLAKCLTDIAGSSAWFEGGFIVYSNSSKQALLSVSPQLITQFGAVSEPVVQALAQGALRQLPAAHCSVAISGIAGPSGGTPAKPVGAVCFAWATRQQVFTHTVQFTSSADRQTIRAWAVQYALQGITRYFMPLPPTTTHA